MDQRCAAARVQRVTISRRSRCADASYAPGSAVMTTSPGSGVIARSIRASSRMQRLMRFRATADLEWRGTTMPIRVSPSSAETTRSSTNSPRNRVPRARTCARSCPRRSRALAPNRKRLCAGVLRRELHCQAAAALSPSSAQDFPPPFGRHPRAEAVLSNSAFVPRAVRWLSHYYS